VILTEVHGEQLARVSGASPRDFFAAVTALGYSCHTIEGVRPGPRLSQFPDLPVVQIALLPER
jgi:hypothetical protein